MASLTPTTALGGIVPRDEVIAEIRITEVADLDLASLAARRDGGTVVKDVSKRLFGGLPAAGRSLSKGGDGIIWMGVDQYLVEGRPNGAVSDSAATRPAATRLAAAFGEAASITDQSDAWVRFDLEGVRAPAMLERLSAADTRRMQAGAAVRTPIHHMLCLVICREDGTRYSVYGPRASAPSLYHALTAAAGSL